MTPHAPSVRVLLVGLAAVLIGVWVSSFQGRTDVVNDAVDACTRGSSSMIANARAHAQDSIREQRLSLANDGSAIRQAHADSASEHAAAATALVELAGISTAHGVSMDPSVVLTLHTKDPNVRAAVSAYCHTEHPDPGPLAFR